MGNFTYLHSLFLLYNILAPKHADVLACCGTHSFLAAAPTPTTTTLKAPQLQHQGAALQVVEQTLGGAEGGEVNPVVQPGVDVVPHSRREHSPAAFKQPEADPEEENTRLRMSFSFFFVLCCPTKVRHERRRLRFYRRIMPVLILCMRLTRFAPPCCVPL